MKKSDSSTTERFLRRFRDNLLSYLFSPFESKAQKFSDYKYTPPPPPPSPDTSDIFYSCDSDEGVYDSPEKLQTILDDTKKYQRYVSKHQFNIFEKVLVRDESEDEWIPAIFARISPRNSKYKFATIDGDVYKQCLPYNQLTCRLAYTNRSLEDEIERLEQKLEGINQDVIN